MGSEVLYMAGIVAAGFAVNFGLRALPFLFFGAGKGSLPPWVERFGAFVSPVIIACLIIYSFSGVQWRTASPYLAAAITVGLQIWRRNPLLSIVVGTVAYMAAIRSMVFSAIVVGFLAGYADAAEPQPANEGREIVLAERGKTATCAIVILGPARASVKYAAEELRDYIRQMTGVELPIIADGASSAVVTQKAVHLRDDDGRAALSKPPYSDDSFRIYAENGILYITGGKRGVLYGVYELLETYGGVGWFSSWRTVVPKRDRFAVPVDIDNVQIPAFAMRSTSWWDVRAHSPTNVQNVAFAAHLRLNGDRNIPRARNTAGYRTFSVAGLARATRSTRYFRRRSTLRNIQNGTAR